MRFDGHEYVLASVVEEGVKALKKERDELKLENERMREALEFYADKGNWVDQLNPNSPMECSTIKGSRDVANYPGHSCAIGVSYAGHIARAALAHESGEKE
jgi:hypothetical protein